MRRRGSGRSSGRSGRGRRRGSGNGLVQNGHLGLQKRQFGRLVRQKGPEVGQVGPNAIVLETERIARLVVEACTVKNGRHGSARSQTIRKNL